MHRILTRIMAISIFVWLAGCGDVRSAPTFTPVVLTATPLPAASTSVPLTQTTTRLEFPTLSPSAKSPKEWRTMFDYDPRQPLDVIEIGSESRENAVMRDIAFASPYGEPISAYLVSPKTGGSYPAILY